MDLAISTEFATTLVGVLAAAAGYAFREYRNRARPFFQVIEIDGGMRKNSDTVPIPPEIVQQASSSAFAIVRQSEDPSELQAVFAAWDHADDIVRQWAKVRDAVDRFVKAESDSAALDALGDLVSLTFFDKWLMLLISSDRLVLPKVGVSSDPKVPVSESDDRQGCVWIGIPGKTYQFGHGLRIPIFRSKVQPFLNAVQQFDRPALQAILESYRDILEREHHVAAAVCNGLKSILDTNSRWFFEVYLANLSAYPMIIETNARLLVRDTHGSTFDQPCYLVKVSYEEDGKRSITDTSTPLVLRNGEDLRFGVMTEKRQKDMERGMALREAFERNPATCRLQLRFQKVGFIKRQRYRSQPIAFRPPATGRITTV